MTDCYAWKLPSGEKNIYTAEKISNSQKNEINISPLIPSRKKKSYLINQFLNNWPEVVIIPRKKKQRDQISSKKFLQVPNRFVCVLERER